MSDNKGWVCPVCGRALAPWVPSCDHEGAQAGAGAWLTDGTIDLRGLSAPVTACICSKDSVADRCCPPYMAGSSTSTARLGPDALLAHTEEGE